MSEPVSKDVQSNEAEFVPLGRQLAEAIVQAAQHDEAEFVPLGRRLAEAIVEAAQHAVVEAQNNLEEAKAISERLLQGVYERNTEHQDLVTRLHNFNKSVLDAAEEYQRVTHTAEGSKDGSAS